jgi:plastocyanin
MSGTALDGTARSGTGISEVQAFLGNRDQGGTFVGAASPVLVPAGIPGSWSLTATLPANSIGGQEMFVYGRSSVSGQEAMVSIPIVVGEGLTNPPIPTMAQSFCPTVMAPAARATPVVSATPQPTAPATAVVAATPQPTAPAVPTVTATPVPAVPAVPVNPPVAAPAPAPAPAAVELSISSPAAPPLSFDTTTLTAPAGASTTVTYTNNEVGVPHNWRVFDGPDSTAPSLAQTQIITGPGTMDSVTFTAPTQTGNYFFWCDVHPTIMTGTLVVQ